MGLSYQVEYRLGARSGRVMHTYRGFPALVAIMLTMALGLVFGTVGYAVRALRFFAINAGRLLAWIVLAPLRLARAILLWVERANPRRKPAWAYHSEL
jgi:hypothetical protein